MPDEQRQLRVPAHGRGFLSVGNPGNRGGISKLIRQNLRELFQKKAIERLESIIDAVDDKTALRAIDLVGKYGLGSSADPTANEHYTDLSPYTDEQLLAIVAAGTGRAGTQDTGAPGQAEELR